MQETQVQTLGWVDPLEKGMATHSCILAWRIPQTEEPDKLQFTGSQRVRHEYTCMCLNHSLEVGPGICILHAPQMILVMGLNN